LNVKTIGFSFLIRFENCPETDYLFEVNYLSGLATSLIFKREERVHSEDDPSLAPLSQNSGALEEEPFSDFIIFEFVLNICGFHLYYTANPSSWVFFQKHRTPHRANILKAKTFLPADISSLSY
jgi:hypothetical protein